MGVQQQRASTGQEEPPHRPSQSQVLHETSLARSSVKKDYRTDWTGFRLLERCVVFSPGHLLCMPVVHGRSADRFCELFLSNCCHQFNNQQLLKRLLKQVGHARTRPIPGFFFFFKSVWSVMRFLTLCVGSEPNPVRNQLAPVWSLSRCRGQDSCGPTGQD